MRVGMSLALSVLLLSSATHSFKGQITQLPSTSSPSATPAVTLTTTSRVVLIDVVVSDGGEPVRGLKKEDYTLLEDGQPQTIAFFEPHIENATSKEESSKEAPKVPSLPAGTYSNLPVSHVTDSVTVLLLDALNTYTEDQLYIRRQMIRYLKTLPSGRRIAVFTLGSRLRLLRGFTSDSESLLVALNSKEANPQEPLVPQKDEVYKDREVLDMLAAGGASRQTIENYKDFMADSKAFQTDMRVNLTLEAMQELGRYLSGIPGRKNLVWFSGSFPLNIFPDNHQAGQLSRDVSRDYSTKVRMTADLLAAARVAVYPVDARGLLLAPMFDVAQQGDYGPTPDRTKRFKDDLAAFQLEAGAEHSAMDLLAKETGGRAVYESNGLKEAMANAISDGSNFYTLAYIPTNKDFDGKFRRIDIKLDVGKYQLFYRRGYFADEGSLPQSRGSKGADGVFVAAMRRGVPSATQIVFDVRVVPSGPQPPPGPIVGENSTLKRPVTRYAVDYAADLSAINLNLTSKGFHKGEVLLVAAAYDREGKLLNAISTTQPIALGPEAYAQFSQNGLQIHQVIDLPKGEVYLRTGIYDPDSGHIGTLEIPMNVAAEKAIASKP